MLQGAKIQAAYFSLLPIAIFAEIWYNKINCKLLLLWSLVGMSSLELSITYLKIINQYRIKHYSMLKTSFKNIEIALHNEIFQS